jgi:hypothetical protein
MSAWPRDWQRSDSQKNKKLLVLKKPAAELGDRKKRLPRRRRLHDVRLESTRRGCEGNRLLTRQGEQNHEETHAHLPKDLLGKA